MNHKLSKERDRKQKTKLKTIRNLFYFRRVNTSLLFDSFFVSIRLTNKKKDCELCYFNDHIEVHFHLQRIRSFFFLFLRCCGEILMMPHLPNMLTNYEMERHLSLRFFFFFGINVCGHNENNDLISPKGIQWDLIFSHFFFWCGN